jgi:CRP-like cAMP-binding protein
LAKVRLQDNLSGWATATTMTDCAVLRIERNAMMQALHREHTFSDLFVAHLLARNIRYEEDLVDHCLIPVKRD